MPLKRIMIVDDSVTTGSSLLAMYKLVNKSVNVKHIANSRKNDVLAYVMFAALQNTSKKTSNE